MDNINAAVAQWNLCLQNEAGRLCHEARIVRANRLEVPEDFEMSLAKASRDHRDGFVSSVTFSRMLERAKEMLVLSWRGR